MYSSPSWFILPSTTSSIQSLQPKWSNECNAALLQVLGCDFAGVVEDAKRSAKVSYLCCSALPDRQAQCYCCHHTHAQIILLWWQRPFRLLASCNVVAGSSAVMSAWCAMVAIRVAYIAMQFKPGDKVMAMTNGGNCRNTTGALLCWHLQYRHPVCLP